MLADSLTRYLPFNAISIGAWFGSSNATAEKQSLIEPSYTVIAEESCHSVDTLSKISEWVLSYIEVASPLEILTASGVIFTIGVTGIKFIMDAHVYYLTVAERNRCDSND